MIVVSFDGNLQLTYAYDDEARNDLSISDVVALRVSLALEDGKKYHGHLYTRLERSERTYHLFFEDMSNIKDARHRGKMIVRGIADYASIAARQADLASYVESSVFHNTKNIIHHLANSLKKVIGYDDLIFRTDKVAEINRLVSRDSIRFAREFLMVSKAIEQVSFEYNIIDYLRPGVTVQEADRTKVKLHSLIVQAFYIYEHEFEAKGIQVKISPTQLAIRGNFFTMRSSLALMMENCIKYCAENTSVEIEFKVFPTLIKIDFTMLSVYNTDEEIQKMFLPRERGTEATKKHDGSGLGLYIAKQLLYLNGIELFFARVNSQVVTKGGFKYCTNMFIVDIPLDYAIRESLN